MQAIIVHSASKEKRAKHIANDFSGDLFEIVPKKQVKNGLFQLIVYGFLTVANRTVSYQEMSFDQEKYEEIVLISPVWAGQTSAYMRQFLLDHPLKNKTIHLIGTSKGGYKKYFAHLKSLLDESNNFVEEIMYVNGEKSDE